jgi:heat-inducible transcriptional repressor
MIELSEREKKILRFVVNHFIATATPVGSRNVSKNLDLGLSSATIRNIMSDLEDSGLLEHPHTSAGRIPTDKGYRVYVDTLIEIPELTDAEKEIIAREIEAYSNYADDLIQMMTHLISDITKHLACITYPKIELGVLEKIRIIKLTSNRILIVISIKSGVVKTITFEIDADLCDEHVQGVENLLNEKLSGLSLAEILSTIEKRIIDVEDKYKPIVRVFLESKEKIFSREINYDKIEIAGIKNLVNKPEFERIEKFRNVVELIDNKEKISKVINLTEKTSQDIVVKIGSENEEVDMSEYSLITKSYKLKDMKGYIGILGPKRMEYGKLIAVVNYASEILSSKSL